MFKIDKGIPLPHGGRRGRPIYPFAEMRPGDSFFVPGKTAYEISGSVAKARRTYPDRDFISRTVDGGVRVWRTK